MVAIFRRWSGKRRRKQFTHSFEFPFLLMVLWCVTLKSVPEVIAQQNGTSMIFKSSSKNATDADNGSGSWEYYYVEDEDDSKNSTSTNNDKSTGRSGKPSNSSLPKDEYYYYMEEEVVVNPKNGSGKVIKTTTLKIDKTRKGKNGEPAKSASSLFPGIESHGIGGLAVLPSIEPFKQLATPLNIDGPVYTDYNFGQGHDYHYQYSGPDTAVAKPLGTGEFPTDPYKEHIQPTLLRPPISGLTQPHAESGIDLDIVKHVEYIDGVNSLSGGGSDDDYKSNSIYDNADDSKKTNDIVTGLILPNLRTKLKVEAYGSIAPEKNPILQAKQFLYHLWEIITNLSKSELLSWAEKGFNVVAELSVSEEHYMRVISFVGIYLFISMLTYGADDAKDFLCALDTQDMPLKQWRYHAARRFVPARSVDPKMQKKFLKLFRGEKDDDEEDDLFDDQNSSSRSSSSEEDIQDELDHISELCPEDAFFYSLNPRHIEAYTTLQRILVAQESPKKFLKLAKRLLYKEKVHPKVWYIAIIGAFLARQDLTGFSVVHPIDAIPDWYIPAHLISDLMRSYKSIRIKRSINSNFTTTSNAMTTLHFSQEDDEESLEKMPFLQLPVNSDKGNFNVTIVTSKKKKDQQDDDSKAASANTSDTSASIPSSEEASNSVEPKEEVKVAVGDMAKVVVKDGGHAKVKDKEHPVAKDKGHVAVKEKRYGYTVAKDKVFKVVKDKKNGYKLVKGKVTVATKQHQHVKANATGSKGDDADLIVKATPGKGNNTVNEYVLDNHGRRRRKGKKKKCIKVNWKVGLDNGVENELWYWREDMMLNQHHWYWHQTHSVNSTQHADRRAEIFVYLHRAMVARYNAERLSNGLKRVKPMKFWDGGIIQSGYNSHLADINSGSFWTPRWPNTPLADIHHEHDPDFAQNITLAHYDLLCRRLVGDIKAGKMLPMYGPPLPINNARGINPLANTIEASDISVNPVHYDPVGIHGLGHIMIGLSSDPDYRFKSPSGIMADAAVSVRDPAFYSYHLFMDDIFELHKERLPPYTVVGGDFPLLWKGVKVTKIELVSQGGPPKNELRTFWSYHRFDLSPGVDRSIKKGKKHKEVCAQHLDHEPFYFKITINRLPCVKSKSGMGTVRIFMAPRYDEKGRRIPVKIQRRLMFPLDSFTVKLRVGSNTITRYAEDSSLTQPWTKSFQELKRGPDPSGAADFCGCGWPQHLFIPKGHVKGMAFDLFVMVTNYDEDNVPNDPKQLEIPETCNSAFIFCGIPRRRYPDRRPMGYPFDRPLFKSFNCPPGWTFSSVVCKSLNLVINKPLDTLEEYVAMAPNMAMLKTYRYVPAGACKAPLRRKETAQGQYATSFR